LALAAGAAIGVITMALFFVAVNARYALVNRALAKNMRQREPPRHGG
jgi:cbb3-type cytochrome oxidase subunit 3